MRTNPQPARYPRGHGSRDRGTSPCLAARLRACLTGCSVALTLAILGLGTARSQTLNEALSAAFAGNPGLDAERARQRADEETIKQERAKGLPNLTLDTYKGGEHTRLNSSSQITKLQPDGYRLTLTQPLFQGFQTFNGTRRAKAEVRAGASQLHDREQSVLLDAVTAYMDVVQDRKIASLRQDNVRFLHSELKATKVRHKAGDLSKTDVAQARTRLFEGKADLAQAQADSEASEASFEAIIGRRPGALKAPRVQSELLPPSLLAALSVADSTNPAIVTALHQREAALRAKREAYGALLPTVSLKLSHGIDHNISSIIDKQEESSLFVRLKMPLYRGGDTSSRIRQARANETSAVYQITDSRRRTRASVIDAWKQLHAARARIRAARQQVGSARQALKGVKIEVRVGERALFELLDAQRELVNGQVVLARSEHDHVVFSYALMSATGRLTARHLSLPVAYPNLNEAVRRKHQKAHRVRRRKVRRKVYARVPENPQLLAPVATASQKVEVQVPQPLMTPVLVQTKWQTSVSEAPPAKPVRLTPKLSRPVARLVQRAARQAPNPLASLRSSLLAD